MIEGIQVQLFLTFISSTLPHWHTFSETGKQAEGRGKRKAGERNMQGLPDPIPPQSPSLTVTESF